MIYIAHRGNLSGPNPKRENSPDYLLEALNQTYDVEVDVWLSESGLFYFGHDYPKYEATQFVTDYRIGIWYHAKNQPALKRLLHMNKHCFMHENDEAALTSDGYIWVWKNRENSGSKSILVLPETDNYPRYRLFGGICTDYVRDYEHFKSDN